MLETGVSFHYGFIYDKDDRDPEQDVELFAEHRYETYAPKVSFYAKFSEICRYTMAII